MRVREREDSQGHVSCASCERDELMTVGELIAELQEFAQDATVLVSSWHEATDQYVYDPAQDVCRGKEPKTVVIL